MSQATASFTVTVKAGAVNPPVIVPATGNLPDEQEGVAVTGDKLATVSGGVPPYNYQFSGQPEGMAFAEKDNGDGSFDLLIKGTPNAGDAAGSPYTINVVVTDSASPSQSAVRSLNVVR